RDRAHPVRAPDPSPRQHAADRDQQRGVRGRQGPSHVGRRVRVRSQALHPGRISRRDPQRDRDPAPRPGPRRAGDIMSESSEFISEAQEIIETFSRQLLEIEGQVKDGDDYDPDLLNGAFRSVHTLKGLSSLSGVNEIVEFSHKLENTLDALRLGKLPLNERALNLLFESIELFNKLLQAVVEPELATHVEVTPFLAKLAKLAAVEEQESEDPPG